jgi:hypothetical protein
MLEIPGPSHGFGVGVVGRLLYHTHSKRKATAVIGVDLTLECSVLAEIQNFLDFISAKLLNFLSFPRQSLGYFEKRDRFGSNLIHIC